MPTEKRTKARQMIEDYHIKKGESVYLQVFGHPEQGLPEDVIQPMGTPTRLDLLGGRPVNAECTKYGFSADLCFHGDPNPCRCNFSWKDVIAISTDPDDGWLVLVQPATAILLEDNTLLVQIQAPPGSKKRQIPEEEDKKIPEAKKKSHLKVVK